MAESATTEHTDDGLCHCIDCLSRREFEMPDALMQACIEGNLVIFCGAGVSTETPRVFPTTLYEQIARELSIDAASQPTFPQLMSAYERKHGRIPLLQKIKRRLDYARSFPALDMAASCFHRELSTIYTIQDIFTTNWDDYFERECAASPFITDKDWAFWNISHRKVFKLHGTITSPGTVIATEEDYKRC